MRCKFILLLILLPLDSFSQPRLLDNEEVIALVKQGINHIYNLENEEADKVINKIETLLPGHPVHSLMKAINISWEEAALQHEEAYLKEHKRYLLLTVERAGKILGKNEQNIEGVFFKLAAHSMLAQYYSEEKEYMKALAEAKQAYSFMKKGFDLKEKYPEFYFSSGLYNYYIEQYPESHPIYKPFMWFFADGDKELGLKYLEKATNTAIFTKVEAMTWLAHIHLRYENKPLKAIPYLKKLAASYPKNLFYKTICSEALITVKEYEEAEPIVEELLQNKKPFFQMAGHIQRGMILEKRDLENDKAKTYYKKALGIANTMESKGETYKTLAYSGLARIAHKEGNQKQAISYYKQALEYAHFESMKEEGEKYLDTYD